MQSSATVMIATAAGAVMELIGRASVFDHENQRLRQRW
jgi:hypothetical protein